MNNEVTNEIIKELETTPLPFCKYAFEDKEGRFCALGVLGYKYKLPFNRVSLENIDKFFEGKPYLNPEEYNRILIQLININDHFSNSHKETAQILKKLTKEYDLDTGKKLAN